MRSLLFILPILLLAGCGTESEQPPDPEPTYKLIVNSVPQEGGNVDYYSHPKYKKDAQIELTAKPSNGWFFVGWSGDASGTYNPTLIKMDSDKEVTALFERLDYSITITTDGQGTVEQVIVQSKTDYPSGTIVQLTAIPDSGWRFNQWQGNISDTQNPTRIVINRDFEIIASFITEEEYINENIDLSFSATTIYADSVWEASLSFINRLPERIFLKRLDIRRPKGTGSGTVVGKYLNQDQGVYYTVSWNFVQPSIEQFKQFKAEWEFDYKDSIYVVTGESSLY